MKALQTKKFAVSMPEMWLIGMKLTGKCVQINFMGVSNLGENGFDSRTLTLQFFIQLTSLHREMPVPTPDITRLT